MKNEPKSPDEAIVRNSQRTRVDPEELYEALQDIQSRLHDVPALNGGFDNLMFKVEQIGVEQTALKDDVKSLHVAIYSPDEGLFSRIRDVKTTSQEQFSKLTDQITDSRREEQQNNVNHQAIQKTLGDHDTDIKVIKDWRARIVAIYTWMFITVIPIVLASAFGLLAKYVYAAFIKP